MRFIQKMTFASLFLAAILFITPAPAKADTIDDLLTHVQSMMEEMAKVQVQLLELKSSGATQTSSSGSSSSVSTPTGSVLGATTFSFSGPIAVGDTSDDVKKIQELLKTDTDIYAEGITSGYYGPATTQAIRNLQERFGLDPVGVVGPATTALLERLISQQNSDGTYPSDILDPARPTGEVAGVSTSAGSSDTSTSDTTTNPLVQKLLEQIEQLKTQQSTQTTTSSSDSTSSSNSSGVSRIDAEIDDRETLVKIFYTNGKQDSFWAPSEDEDEVIEYTAEEYDLSESLVEDLIDFDDYDSPSSGSDADDIDEIVIDVDVEDGEAEIEVIFEDEDEDNEEFTVEEVDLEDIVEEIADELDIDEDDVYDLMDLDYNIDAEDIDEIVAEIDEDEGEVDITVELESGDDFDIWLEEDDEDDIIEELADLLDLDEEEVDDLIDFD